VESQASSSAPSVPTNPTQSPQWHFWIDRGGTFTDIVAQKPDGSLVTAKLLSDNPDHYRDAAIAGIRELMCVPEGAGIPTEKVAEVRMGTTVATNALLQRRGAKTILAITKGFGDQLRIGYQNRPRLFDRQIVLPPMLYHDVIEIDERLSAGGEIVRPLDEAATEAALRAAKATGAEAIAIVLMHGYQFTQHERRVAELARRAGFAQISVSHEVSPLIKLVARGDTTVMDGYLSPILARYVQTVAAELPGVRLRFMQSNGGLTDAHAFRGKDAVLSGPAGGIIGMTETAIAADLPQVIGFDMGGTSTDVSHFAGELERVFDTVVDGIRARAPMLSIHTIAAGGGSILKFDGERFRVGPESAGALPGPACYGRGGPLTVTDANLLLGRISAQDFPHVFGKDGRSPLDAARTRRLFDDLAQVVSRATGIAQSAHAVAEGFLAIANHHMANAIRRISIERGHDVSRYALQCFGGAGGQHACGVADALGMKTIMIHPFAGVLSAYGMGLADVIVMRETSVEKTLNGETLVEALALADSRAKEAVGAVAAQGVPLARIGVRQWVHLKYVGTDSALPVHYREGDTTDGLRTTFEALYRQRFGFLMRARALVIDAISVEARSERLAQHVHAAHNRRANDEATRGHAPATAETQIWSVGAWHRAALIRRESLASTAHCQIDGPALITEPHATTVVEPGWSARQTDAGVLILTRTLSAPQDDLNASTKALHVALDHADPVQLEVFQSQFMAIAEEMGTRLTQTAYSVNIKERLDFSCALFDAAGNLIANAPHMPVHLGSMGDSVRSVVERNRGRMRSGESYALNDPYHGGTHLPDITVVTPVFVTGDAEPAFFVASRGHHADVGGMSPGSMPPFSRTIQDEGILIDNLLVVADSVFREDALRDLLSSGPQPARNVEQNLADLRAQVAANMCGFSGLQQLVARHGHSTIARYMQHVQDNAERAVRHAIRRLNRHEIRPATIHMDNGATIAVRVSLNLNDGSAVVDFTGTSAVLNSNFNAPSSVVTAAVLYVFRMLVASDIPLNAGCLRPITIIIPPHSMLSPSFPAAVVAGNVETSQAITDALVSALGVMAPSGGSMNNLTFGNDTHQYYETVSGGTGAGPGFDGCSAVQAHMTNSRMTDPEVLEQRFPIRVEEHSIRRGSGGVGTWRGGDGATRRIRFLTPMTVAVLAGNRIHKPMGAAGGGAAAVGENWVEHVDGRHTMLTYADETAVGTGDVFVLHTPGGGGWGAPERPSEK
jgi:5-oxoprolinase (ATP-hydrolysing)